MEFQIARNLSAIGRAQEDVAHALRHIETIMDCLNREVIVSVTVSEAADDLLSSARDLLTQVQQLLNTQSEEGAERLRTAQIAFLQEHISRNPSLTNSSSSQVNFMTNSTDSHSRDTHREVDSDGHSYANTVVRGRVRCPDESE